MSPSLVARAWLRAAALVHPLPADLRDVAEGTARARAAAEADVLIMPPDPVLEDLCRRASEACGTPWAVLTIITAREQVVKATWGDGPDHPGRRVPLAWSLCAYVVRDDAPLELPDTSARPDVAACLALPHVGAYLGAPIRSRYVPIGALAGLAPAPQTFPAGAAVALGDLAERASRLIEQATAWR